MYGVCHIVVTVPPTHNRAPRTRVAELFRELISVLDSIGELERLD